MLDWIAKSIHGEHFFTLKLMFFGFYDRSRGIKPNKIPHNRAIKLDTAESNIIELNPRTKSFDILRSVVRFCSEIEQNRAEPDYV